MEKQKLSKEEVDVLWTDLQEKKLIRWYDKWRDNAWGYALQAGLKKFPIFFAFWLLVSMEKAKQFFASPSESIMENSGMFLMGILLFILLNRFSWRRKALTYYLHALRNPDFPQPDEDHKIVLIGRKTEKRLPRKWQKWKDRSGMLSLACAAGAAALFVIVFYLLHRTTGKNWSWNSFMEVFEPGVFYIVVSIFFLLGGFIGYSIWAEMRDHFKLLIQKDSENATSRKNALS